MMTLKAKMSYFMIALTIIFLNGCAHVQSNPSDGGNPRQGFFYGKDDNGYTKTNWVNGILFKYEHTESLLNPSPNAHGKDRDPNNEAREESFSLNFPIEQYTRKALVYFVNAVKIYILYPDLMDMYFMPLHVSPTIMVVKKGFKYDAASAKKSDLKRTFNFSIINFGQETENGEHGGWASVFPLFSYWGNVKDSNVIYLTPFNYLCLAKEGCGFTLLGLFGYQHKEHQKILPFYFHKHADAVLPTPELSPWLSLYVNNETIIPTKRVLFFNEGLKEKADFSGEFEFMNESQRRVYVDSVEGFGRYVSCGHLLPNQTNEDHMWRMPLPQTMTIHWWYEDDQKPQKTTFDLTGIIRKKSSDVLVIRFTKDNKWLVERKGNLTY